MGFLKNMKSDIGDFLRSISYCGMMSRSKKLESELDMLTDCDLEKDMIVDRLNSLPECLVVEILSRLPIKDAVATSVLSRPWRYLWKHITRLNIDPLDKQGKFPFESKNILKYINRVHDIFRQITTSNIHSFNAVIPDARGKDFSLTDLFEQILERNVLEIKISVLSNPVNLPPVLLPVCLLQSKSLESLELSGLLSYNTCEDGIIGFSNLKKLKIQISNKDLKSMQKLLKSIPALQVLDLSLHELDDECVKMFAPALKSLTIRMNCQGYMSQSKIVIDSPKLEYLKIKGDLVWYHFVNNQTQPQTADISGYTYWEHEVDQRKKLCCLDSCISSVTALRLNSYGFLPVLNTSAYSEDRVDLTGVFRNLIYLSIKARYNAEVNWSERIPTWVLSKLKRVDVMVTVHNGDCKAINLLEYILSNSDVLERLVVVVSSEHAGRYDQLTSGEEAFCRVLFGLTKNSSNCEIQFRGRHYSSSIRGIDFLSQRHGKDIVTRRLQKLAKQ